MKQPFKQASEHDLKRFMLEMEVMHALRHPNLVRYLGTVWEPSPMLVAEYLEKFASFDKGLEGSSKGPCFAGEQAFLNRYIGETTQIQCLDRKYNCRRGFQDKCCGGDDTRIIHWSGGIKPWTFDRSEVLATSMAAASAKPWETCNPPGTKLDRQTNMYRCCQSQKAGRGQSTVSNNL